ncbi:MAG TPA: glycosyltransferase 87 family protein [Candidatus Saccharimonadales bacterium]|nr:glycosyltransferase 87 family protein [Candidatus Saccharimonadales bacterium]
MVGRDDLAYAAGIAFGAVVLVLSGYADRPPEIVMHNDFALLWSGSRTVLDGATPYDPAAFVATTTRYGTEHPPGYNFYTYPGWVAVALIPFALLPLPVASAIWAIGGIVAAVLALRLLLREYCAGVPVIHTLAGLTLLASQPGRLTVLLGQWGFVLLAASAATVAWLSAARAARAGASASLFLAKPQLLVGAAFGLAVAAVARGHARRFLIAALGITVLATAASLIVLPGWPVAWRTTVPGALLPDPPQTTTTFTLLYGVFGRPGVAIAIGVIVVGGLLALLFRPESDAWLAMWLALSPVAAIYAWSYDHTLVIVPLVVATGIALRRSRGVAVAATLGWTLLLDIGTTALAVVAARRDNESYSAVIPLIAFALVAVLVWPERRFRRGSVRSSARPTGSSP